MLHDGQLEGRQAFARIQLNRREAEAPDPEITSFYDGLLTGLHNTLVRKCRGTVLKTAAAETVAVQWEGNGCDVAVVNLADDESELFLPAAEVPGPGEPRLLYSMGGQAEISAVEGGLRLRLPGQSAQIVRVRHPARD